MRSSRTRSRARHHRTVRNRRWRRRHAPVGIRRTGKAAPIRREVRAVGHLRTSQRRLRNRHRSALDGLPVHERTARSCRYSANVIRVSIVKIVMIRVVQDIDVGDPRIRDVHVAEIISAGVIPRMVRFAESQGEPADSAAKSATETEATSKVTAADEADERWSIERTRINRSRAPAPTAAYIRPASIVKWRKAPWLITHPSPAPRTNVVPVTIAIWRPAHFHGARVPDRTVIRLFSP